MPLESEKKMGESYTERYKGYSPLDLVSLIVDICVDYDGCDNVGSLKDLVDEIHSLARIAERKMRE